MCVCVCVMIFEMKKCLSGHLNPVGFSLCPQPEKLSIKRPSVTNRAHFFLDFIHRLPHVDQSQS